MRLLTNEELKKVETDILVDVAGFCDKNNLSYFIAYGTLIGAVRHQGFIPWDDDIDIQMPRADYEIFIRSYNKKGNRYQVVSPQDKIAKHPYAKVIDTQTVKYEYGHTYKYGTLGADIDVFPLDGQPNHEQDYVRWYNKLQSIYTKYHYASIAVQQFSKDRWKLLIKKILGGSRKKLLEKAQKLHKQYPIASSKYLGAIESAFNGIGNRAEKECFANFVLLEFEGHMLKAPVGYDQVLKNLYGDYMKLPPIEKQVTHHNNTVYWKEG